MPTYARERGSFDSAINERYQLFNLIGEKLWGQLESGKGVRIA